MGRLVRMFTAVTRTFGNIIDCDGDVSGADAVSSSSSEADISASRVVVAWLGAAGLSSPFGVVAVVHPLSTMAAVATTMTIAHWLILLTLLLDSPTHFTA